MTQQDKIRVTTKQNEYLLQLAKGPQTTNDLMRSIMVSAATAAKIISKLRGKGLVVSERVPGARGNVRIHTLVMPYNELNLLIRTTGNNGNWIVISDEEVLYAAILRNACMTGQRLTDQFKKVFPNRTKSTIIKNIVLKARKGGLCR